MPAPGTELYFIAIIPPPAVCAEVIKIKEHIRDNYRSKGALNSPPHITLHMPFEWKVKKEDKLLEALEKFASGKKSFPVELKNFSCFAPKVIFISVTHSNELNDLQQQLHRFCKVELNLFNAAYRDLPFHPHVTVAFRDLKKDQFALAWKEFERESFDAKFEANGITLLKHNGKHWDTLRDFHF